MKTASFRDDLSRGSRYEHTLDEVFSRWFRVYHVAMTDQKRGIDRVFEDQDGQRLTVEYKGDTRAHQTGNAFIETVSIDTLQRPGWAHSSQSKILAYFVVQDRLIYWVQFEQLRLRLPAWEQRYEKRTIPNQGYRTIGLLVPLAELEAAAEQVITF